MAYVTPPPLDRTARRALSCAPPSLTPARARVHHAERHCQAAGAVSCATVAMPMGRAEVPSGARRQAQPRTPSPQLCGRRHNGPRSTRQAPMHTARPLSTRLYGPVRPSNGPGVLRWGPVPLGRCSSVRRHRRWPSRFVRPIVLQLDTRLADALGSRAARTHYAPHAVVGSTVDLMGRGIGQGRSPPCCAAALLQSADRATQRHWPCYTRGRPSPLPTFYLQGERAGQSGSCAPLCHATSRGMNRSDLRTSWAPRNVLPISRNDGRRAGQGRRGARRPVCSRWHGRDSATTAQPWQ